MSLFRKKKWDIERSEQNKGLIRQLFSQAMPDGDTWKIVYGYGLNIKTTELSIPIFRCVFNSFCRYKNMGRPCRYRDWMGEKTTSPGRRQ